MTLYPRKLQAAICIASVTFLIVLEELTHPNLAKSTRGRTDANSIMGTSRKRHWWNIQGGRGNSVIQTDCGPIGVMICYDSEFPELARHLVDQGALMLFVPFCTDSRQGYLRVRYCGQARAIENQCFTVLSGNVGNLPNVANMDIQYAQSCILTPCDFPFARDGIAAETSENVETIAVADRGSAAP